MSKGKKMRKEFHESQDSLRHTQDHEEHPKFGKQQKTKLNQHSDIHRKK